MWEKKSHSCGWGRVIFFFFIRNCSHNSFLHLLYPSSFFLSLSSLPPSLPVPLLLFFLPFFPSIYSGSLGLFLRSGLKLSIEKLDFITKSQMPLLKMFYLFIFGQPIPCMSTFLISFYLIQMYSVSLSSCILERALLYIISPN